jgi:hypothetical protein
VRRVTVDRVSNIGAWRCGDESPALNNCSLIVQTVHNSNCCRLGKGNAKARFGYKVELCDRCLLPRAVICAPPEREEHCCGSPRCRGGVS